MVLWLEKGISMLIICSQDEKKQLRTNCGGDCDHCVFSDVICPLEDNMVITYEQAMMGKGLEIKIKR